MARKPKRVNSTGRVVPITNRPLYKLRQVVNALNGKIRQEQILGPDDARAEEIRQQETPPLLREIVQSWKSSGPDLFKFSIHNRTLWTEIEKQWKKTPTKLVGAPGGGAAIFWNAISSRDPQEEAFRWFIELLVNPECERLAGPCARCGSYYIRGSIRNKSYCSRSCGTRATAKAATAKRRATEKTEKLLRASKLIQKWSSARAEMDWKQWVSRRRDITPKFLTRAVNSGELVPPKLPKSEILNITRKGE